MDPRRLLRQDRRRALLMAIRREVPADPRNHEARHAGQPSDLCDEYEGTIAAQHLRAGNVIFDHLVWTRDSRMTIKWLVGPDNEPVVRQGRQY